MCASQSLLCILFHRRTRTCAPALAPAHPIIVCTLFHQTAYLVDNGMPESYGEMPRVYNPLDKVAFFVIKDSMDTLTSTSVTEKLLLPGARYRWCWDPGCCCR